MKSYTSDSITITWKFNVEISKLWDAWTDPAYVKRWFGSDPNGTVLEALVDINNSKSFKVTFQNSNGSLYTCFGTYIDIQKFEKLSFTWSWIKKPKIVETIEVEFEKIENRTLMTFIHKNIKPGTGHNYEMGWRSTFTKLESLLEKN